MCGVPVERPAALSPAPRSAAADARHARRRRGPGAQVRAVQRRSSRASTAERGGEAELDEQTDLCAVRGGGGGGGGWGENATGLFVLFCFAVLAGVRRRPATADSRCPARLSVSKIGRAHV